MSNISSPGSWVDDMSAVLNKVPQLSNGSPGGVGDPTTEPQPTNGSPSAPAAAGQESAAPAQPPAAAATGQAAADDSAAQAVSANTPPADVKQPPAAQPAAPASTSLEQITAPPIEAAAAPAAGQEAAEAAPDAVEEPAPAAEGAAPEAHAAPAAGLADGDAAGQGFSTLVKAQQPAPAASLETPAAVRSLTGVEVGFQDPSSAGPKAKQSAADVVAASLAEAAPVPEDEKEFDTFQEAVGEELQLAKAASDAAKAMGTPGAADDILAQMSGSRPGTPEAAAIAAAAGEDAFGTAKDIPSADKPEAEPAAVAADAAAPDVTEASAAEADGPSVDAAKAAPSAAAAANAEAAPAEAEPSADGDKLSPPEPTAADAEAPEPASDATQTPLPGDGAAEPAAAAAAAVSAPGTPAQQPTQESSSPAAISTEAASAAPATPDAPTANSAVESPATPEPLRTPSSIAARIAALKTSPPPAESSPSTPSALPNGDTTPKSVKARIAAMRRTSETFNGETSPWDSIPRPSPSASPTRRWSINTPKSPSGPPASGEVVAEEGKPKEELKSFWEAHQPVDVIPPSPPRRSTADASNVGKKWQVKLNTPLASGKVSDLSYFRSPKSEASPLPPPPEYKHKIGEATFPLDELKGMNADHGIDPANKELYLSDDDFQTAFEMDKEAYKGKPKWRQVVLKKKVGMF